MRCNWWLREAALEPPRFPSSGSQPFWGRAAQTPPRPLQALLALVALRSVMQFSQMERKVNISFLASFSVRQHLTRVTSRSQGRDSGYWMKSSFWIIHADHHIKLENKDVGAQTQELRFMPSAARHIWQQHLQDCKRGGSPRRGGTRDAPAIAEEGCGGATLHPPRTHPAPMGATGPGRSCPRWGREGDNEDHPTPPISHNASRCSLTQPHLQNFSDLFPALWKLTPA